MNKDMKKAIEDLGVKVYGDKVMIDDILYPLPLVQGNDKLGNDVWHSSTVPTNGIITATLKDGSTISECGTCRIDCKGCYGKVGNYRFNSVKFALIMRTRLLRKHMDIYFALVDIQLTYEDIKKLRIHAVGDFIDGEADGFRKVLEKHPNIKAWTYTKCEETDEIKALNALPNCNIVKSVIKGCGFNFGHVAYIANMFYYLKRLGKSVYICRCGIDENQHCSNCDGCSDHEYVLFIEHSTNYKAWLDYGFSKIIWLIENQKNIG